MKLNGEDIFSIGEMSKMCGIPIHTIRYYDERALIRPVYVNQESGYRYYNWDSVSQLSLLRTYKHYGFTLRESQSIMNGMDIRSHLNDIEKAFKTKLDELENRILQMNINYDSLKTWFDLIHLANTIWQMEEVPIEQIYFPKINTLKIRPENYQENSLKSLIVNVDFVNEIYKNNKDDINKDYFVNTIDAMYVDFPNQKTRLDNDFKNCMLYFQSNPLCQGNWTEFGGFPAVITYHRGNPNIIQSTYQKVYEWAGRHNFELKDNVIEQYILDYWTTLEENMFIIKLIFPLKN